MSFSTAAYLNTLHNFGLKPDCSD